MAEGYRTFGSHILFKQYTADAFGHLYRAGEFDSTGVTRTVFLRTLDAPEVPVREVIEGFDTGRHIAQVLVAANVASGATFQEHDGVPALICDWNPAQALSTVLERVRGEGFPVPVDNALLVLEKLALGVSAALALEIDGLPLVHGLLHPSLILLTTDGEALITGYGVADRLLGILDHPQVASAVHPYLAPELLETRTPSKRSDVYSLGAILIELLTAQPLAVDPAERTGALDRATLAYDDRPLPDDITSLLARAIASRPEDRFSSSADFKKELDRLLYGGPYSPTTFNLALFMDRLFRAEMESEERERSDEQSVDVSAYLVPEPVPLPEPAPMPAPRHLVRPGVWIAAAATVAVALTVAGVRLLTDRSSVDPGGAPTPTAQQLEAERQEQERRLQEMVQQMVQEKMAEKEEEIRQELLARQERIEDLQRRLRESERRARQTRPSPEEQQRQQQLAREIAAEEEAVRQQEAELEAERLRRLEEAEPSATATAVSQPAVVSPTIPPPSPTATQQPTPVPSPTPTEIPVVENAFYEPFEVDTLPGILKEYPVTWSRLALRSRRQGLVIVQATVNAEGRVDEVKVLRADHEGFGIPQSVMEAVRKYRFKPAVKNGVRVKSYATVTMRYRFRP